MLGRAPEQGVASLLGIRGGDTIHRAQIIAFYKSRRSTQYHQAELEKWEPRDQNAGIKGD